VAHAFENHFGSYILDHVEIKTKMHIFGDSQT
jgi:hypothetical protein